MLEHFNYLGAIVIFYFRTSQEDAFRGSIPGLSAEDSYITIKFFTAFRVFYEFSLHFFIDQQVFPQRCCLIKLIILLSMCNALKRV